MFSQTVFEVFFVSKYYSLALSLESLVLQQPVNTKISAQFIFVATVIIEFLFCGLTVGLLWNLKTVLDKPWLPSLCVSLDCLPLFFVQILFIYSFLKLKRIEDRLESFQINRAIVYFLIVTFVILTMEECYFSFETA